MDYHRSVYETRQAGFMVGLEMDFLWMVAGRRTLSQLLSIMDNESHPLHTKRMK